MSLGIKRKVKACRYFLTHFIIYYQNLILHTLFSFDSAPRFTGNLLEYPVNTTHSVDSAGGEAGNKPPPARR